MATDWSSVKPSLCRRCTNLRVSKWWSRARRAVAWKDLCKAGCRRMADGRGRLAETEPEPVERAAWKPAVWMGCHGFR